VHTGPAITLVRSRTRTSAIGRSPGGAAGCAVSSPSMTISGSAPSLGLRMGCQPRGADRRRSAGRKDALFDSSAPARPGRRHGVGVLVVPRVSTRAARCHGSSRASAPSRPHRPERDSGAKLARAGFPLRQSTVHCERRRDMAAIQADRGRPSPSLLGQRRRGQQGRTDAGDRDLLHGQAGWSRPSFRHLHRDRPGARARVVGGHGPHACAIRSPAGSASRRRTPVVPPSPDRRTPNDEGR